MAEKLIGSLIYGEHETPKKSRPWQQALKVPVTIGLVLIFIGGLAYKFANFREEGRVRLLIEAIRNAQYDVAYQNWDAEALYTMNHFLQHWGKGGNDIKILLTPAGRSELKRDGNVSQVKIEIDRIAAPKSLAPAFNTYVVWAVSPEGIFDNLGELQINGNKGQFTATTRFGQFGILISAEPHYLVDRPSSAVAYRGQTPKTDVRRKMVSVEVGSYDYSSLAAPCSIGLQGWIVQARAAFQIARNAAADRLAPEEFRNAQVAI